MNSISGQKLRQMLVCAANELEREKKTVDELNVFPVPDGDTGTNMSLTVTSAIKEVLSCESDAAGDIAHAASSGALRGARGNSGVIVSQLFRGMYKSMKGMTQITASQFSAAMDRGVATAYKAVMKPKEGTILTVARESAAAAAKACRSSSDVTYVMEQAYEASLVSLENTPNLLPVLKEAGVVDSGGKGLTLLYKGFLEALRRDDETVDEVLAFSETPQAGTPVVQTADYCVEAVVGAGTDSQAAEKMPALEEDLKGMGENVIVLSSGHDLKVHIHTQKPGQVISRLTEIGSLSTCKVENTAISHKHILDLQDEIRKDEPRKDVGFIAIAAGEGLSRLFKELGVDCVVTGGQTMNPSTEDILEAAGKVNADHVIVLPNNKNIILAAEQAAKLVKDKRLHVIPTKNIPQGITAMISFMPGTSLEENLEAMKSSLDAVLSGSVTYAIRDTHIGDFQIHAGDYLGMKNGELMSVGKTLMDTASNLADDLVSEDTGIFTIYFGKDSSAEQAEQLKSHVLSRFPAVDVEVQEGGQPVYYFILSAE